MCLIIEKWNLFLKVSERLLGITLLDKNVELDEKFDVSLFIFSREKFGQVLMCSVNNLKFLQITPQQKLFSDIKKSK
jgi:hypothetical protein